MSPRRWLLGAVLLPWMGCSQNLPPLSLPDGCQPLLAPTECLLPFPSDFFRVPDDRLPSGARIELTGAARLETDGGRSATPGDGRPADGASRLAMPTATLGVAVSSRGLVGYFDEPSLSVTPSSRTLLIEAASGRLVPHFVDLDPRASSPERQALVFHPLVSMAARTRYVVVLQGLETPTGEAAATPEGFRRLRDREASGDPILEPLSKRFERDVFPLLDRVKVEREAVQLAWDFTTGSDEHIEADLLAVRSLTQAWLASNTPAVAITEVIESPAPNAWRTVHGTFTAPDYLEGDDLHRDQQGRVAQKATTVVPFTAVVPKVLRDVPGAAVALGYGHGSFGSRDEILDAHPRRIATETRSVLFSTDWVGMARPDALKVLSAIGSEPSQALAFADRVPQGMSNWMVLSVAIAGPMRALPAFQSDEGEPLYAAEASRFLGISQGHLLGGVLAAVHPGLSQVALSSGGSGFSHMLSRSRPLSLFFFPLDLADAYDRRRFEATLQPYFDRIDGAFWARRVLAEPLPDAAERRVLLQIGLGDVEVPNIGAFLHARTLKIPLLEPSPLAVPLLETVTSPTRGSALALFDMGIDLREVYEKAQPAGAENAVHLGMRNLPGAREQLAGFFAADGEISSRCEGCDD